MKESSRVWQSGEGKESSFVRWLLVSSTWSLVVVVVVVDGLVLVVVVQDEEDEEEEEEELAEPLLPMLLPPLNRTNVTGARMCAST